jgi:hypothetical protein
VTSRKRTRSVCTRPLPWTTNPPRTARKRAVTRCLRSCGLRMSTPSWRRSRNGRSWPWQPLPPRRRQTRRPQLARVAAESPSLAREARDKRNSGSTVGAGVAYRSDFSSQRAYIGIQRSPHFPKVLRMPNSIGLRRCLWFMGLAVAWVASDGCHKTSGKDAGQSSSGGASGGSQSDGASGTPGFGGTGSPGAGGSGVEAGVADASAFETGSQSYTLFTVNVSSGFAVLK